MIFGSWRNIYFCIKLLAMTGATAVSTPDIGKSQFKCWGGERGKVKSSTSLSIKKHNLASSKGQSSQGFRRIKLNREQKSIFALHHSLQALKTERSLDQKNVQIKYVNTLKKIKQTSRTLGCKVKVQSRGFVLQGTKQKHNQTQEVFDYNFGKQFNRYFRRRLAQRLNSCTEANRSLHTTMDQNVKEMKDALSLNKKTNDSYKQFTSKRMETYLKGVSNQKKKMPFFSKKGLDKSFEKARMQLQLPTTTRKISEVLYETQEEAEPSNPQSPSKTPTVSQKWSQLILQYHADIQQFQEICDFLEKIQHQMLRYMPNNHLSNKINNIISQVQHSHAIRKIYDQCNADVSVLTPQRILKYLKKEDGILSSLNYIVNVIKLNISAQRRKRFHDLQQTIQKYQGLTLESASAISDKLKVIESPWLKKKINDTVKMTDTSCRGLDPSYLSFVRQAEEQEFSSINSNKNRNIICEILKFQTLMR